MASKPGDWKCPRCGDNVFARKTECRCGTKKPAEVKPGDWKCKKCGDNVFASRSHCRCGEAKGIASTHECVICMDKPKEMMLEPCKHLAVCYTCSLTLMESSLCPVCRHRFNSAVRVFIA